MIKYQCDLWLGRAKLQIFINADSLELAIALVHAFYPAADDAYIYEVDDE